MFLLPEKILTHQPEIRGFFPDRFLPAVDDERKTMHGN